MILKPSIEAQNAIECLFKSKATNIVDFANDIGADIQTFFEGEDWSGLDLRTCDLEGVSFFRANMDYISVYADQLKLIAATKPKSMHSPSVHVRPSNEPEGVSKPIDEFAERARLWAFRKGLNAPRAEYVKAKMSYQEMVDRGWNPPAKVLRLLINDADRFEMALQFADELSSRGLSLDSQNTEALTSLCNSVKEGKDLLQFLRYRGESAFDVVAQDTIDACKTMDSFKLLWDYLSNLTPLPKIEIFDQLVAKAPSSSFANFVVDRLVIKEAKLTVDTFEALWSSWPRDKATVDLIIRLASKGLEPAVEFLQTKDRNTASMDL